VGVCRFIKRVMSLKQSKRTQYGVEAGGSGGGSNRKKTTTRERNTGIAKEAD